MTKGYILKPGAADWAPITLTGYDELSAAIGGYIQVIPVDEPVTLYCHEEGKILALPASAVWLYNGHPHDTIRGPIVLFGPPDGEGDDTDANSTHLAAIKGVIAPVVNLLTQGKPGDIMSMITLGAVLGRKESARGRKR